MKFKIARKTKTTKQHKKFYDKICLRIDLVANWIIAHK